MAEAAGGAGLTPGARREALEITAGKVLATVRARPEDGKANEAVRSLLAKALGLPASQVQLVRGAKAREKVFRVDR